MPNAKLASLSSQIQGVTDNLILALQSLDSVEGRSAETSKVVSTSLEEAISSVTKASKNIGDNLTGIETRTASTKRAIESDLRSTSGYVQESADSISDALDLLLNRSATVIDDIRSALANSTGPFNEDLKSTLDLVELGILRVDEINNAYLNAEVNGSTLREQLSKLDFRKFEGDIRNLIDLMKKGQADIGSVIEFLTERGGELGKSISAWINDLQSGNITITRFRDEISRLLKSLENIEGADADTLKTLLDAVGDLFENDDVSS